jgi:glycosyltransferase involved in cell wall biosynthesis
MNILYHHRIRSKDGQAVHLEQLIRALRRTGHAVHLVGPKDFEHSQFGSEPTLLGKAKRLAPAALYELAELCYNIPAFARLFAATVRTRPRVIYERYNLYSLAGVWVSKVLSVPLLLEINAPLARERARFGGLAFPRLAQMLERWTWRSASFVLPVTRVLAEDVRASVPPQRIRVIPNAIDHAEFASAPDPDTAKATLDLSGKLVLGFVGFAREWHGLEILVELLTRDDTPDNLHVMIVGEGPAIGPLKGLSQRSGVSHRVTFAGLVAHERIMDYVAAFDIAVLPSCVSYCSPLKLFEYMALGKAIVAPDQPNIREVLVHKESALLFKPDEPASLGDSVVRLANDPNLRPRLGEAARALIGLAGYSWEQNAERVADIGSRCAEAVQRRE